MYVKNVGNCDIQIKDLGLVIRRGEVFDLFGKVSYSESDLRNSLMKGDLGRHIAQNSLSIVKKAPGVPKRSIDVFKGCSNRFRVSKTSVKNDEVSFEETLNKYIAHDEEAFIKELEAEYEEMSEEPNVKKED